MYQERRIKIYEIPFHKLTWAIMPSDVWQRVSGNNLPEDAVLLDVWAVQARGTFQFVVKSDTFEEVAMGCHPPVEQLQLELKELKEDG